MRRRVLITGFGAATVLALRDRVAPPTLNYEQQDEGLDLDCVPDGPRPLARHADGNASAHGRATTISNSFGFGGHNAVLCLGAAGTGYELVAPAQTRSPPAWPFRSLQDSR